MITIECVMIGFSFLLLCPFVEFRQFVQSVAFRATDRRGREGNLDHDFRYIKFIYLHCGEETKLRDLCS